MPKPHYPPQGGPYLPAWAKPSQNAAESGAQTGGQKPAPVGKSPNQAVESERIRRERFAPQIQPRWLAEHPGKASVKMVWVALGVCGAVLVFALLALLRHG